MRKLIVGCVAVIAVAVWFEPAGSQKPAEAFQKIVSAEKQKSPKPVWIGVPVAASFDAN